MCFQASPVPLLAIAVLLAMAASPASGDAAAEFSLLGSWHVLVHYTDKASADPEAHRWGDRVWKLERKGSRLQWTDYPIVVFDDERGRFTTIAGTTRARVLEYWEPDARQLGNIREGLQINARESKAKTLRGSMQRGFASSGSLRSSSSSVIGYLELWRIDDPSGKPVFTRDDILGSARTENMQGRTRYTTLEILEGGRVLRGRFERDASLSGEFRMTRTGDVRLFAGEDERDPDEAMEIALGFAVDRGPAAAELEELLEGADPASERSRARELIRTMLERDLRARGQELAPYYPRIESLSEKILVVLIDEGASLDEVETMLRRAELLP